MLMGAPDVNTAHARGLCDSLSGRAFFEAAEGIRTFLQGKRDNRVEVYGSTAANTVR
jgi:hypothetical protein